MLPQASATGFYGLKEVRVHAIANHSTIAKLKKAGGSILPNVGAAVKRALAPAAQNFFANPQNADEEGWKEQVRMLSVEVSHKGVFLGISLLTILMDDRRQDIITEQQDSQGLHKHQTGPCIRISLVRTNLHHTPAFIRPHSPGMIEHQVWPLTREKHTLWGRHWMIPRCMVPR